jgi:F-type H+-transporting ATPase subunit c
MMDPATLLAVLETTLSQADADVVESAITGKDLIKAGALMGAGICMGFGAIGPGIGEGFAAGKACEAIGRAPEEAGLLTRTMLIGQAVSESTGIYSLVVALLMLFVVGV